MEFKSKERILVTRVRRYADEEESFEEDTISIAHHFSSVYNGYEGDDEVFIESEDLKSPEGLQNIHSVRERRISDVIDSRGDESPGPFSPGPPRAHTSPNLAGTRPEIFFSSDFMSMIPPSPVTPRSDHGYSSSSAINSPLSTKRFQGTCDLPTESVFESRKFDTTDANPNALSSTETSTSVYIRNDLTVIAPVERDSWEYNMNHKHRGIGLVFNHRIFKSQPEREGTEKDVERLAKMYDTLGLETRIYHDLDGMSIMKTLKGISLEDHSERDCVVVTILTHGFQSSGLWSYDMPYSLNDVWNFFSPELCLSLAGKPKIFFIQACRGVQTDSGVQFVSQKFSQTDSSFESYTIPRMADYFTAHSTPEGFFSWRNPEYGTWFIKALSEVFSEDLETNDLSTIMLRVSHKVAIEYQSVNEFLPWRDQMKQVPCTTSTLIRQVFFRKKSQN